MTTVRVGVPDETSAVVALYEAVGWTAYTADPAALARALEASTWVATAWHEERLVGLVRVLSDEVAIAWIQDVLVHPDHQRQGIGRALVEAALERFAGVRAVALLTDDRPEQHAFYRALGLANTRDLVRTPLNAWVRFRGIDLA